MGGGRKGYRRGGRRGKPCFRDGDIAPEGLYGGRIGPDGAVWTKRGNGPQQAGCLSRFVWAEKDAVVEGLLSGVAAGAGCVGVFLEPGRVGGEIAFSHCHLVYAAGNKLVKAHEGVGGEAWQMVVVWRGGEVFFTLFQDSLSGLLPEGHVGSGQEGSGR